jgi:hypothetical protein
MNSASFSGDIKTTPFRPYLTDNLFNERAGEPSILYDLDKRLIFEIKIFKYVTGPILIIKYPFEIKYPVLNQITPTKRNINMKIIEMINKPAKSKF